MTVVNSEIDSENCSRNGEFRLARALSMWADAVTPVAAVGALFTAEVRSQSDPAHAYLVTLAPDGCDCIDFRIHNRPCKHILAARLWYTVHWPMGEVA